MKLNFILLPILLLSAFTGCREWNSGQSNVVYKVFQKNHLMVRSLEIENDSVSFFIEGAGDVKFSADGRKLVYLSPGGYVKYRSNTGTFEASASGHLIRYNMEGDAKNNSDGTLKSTLLREAVHAYSALLSRNK